MIGLVTGANRGLGYEMIKEGLRRGHTMLAACRNTGDENSVGGLLKLEEQYPGSLKILEMDVTDREMTEKAALQVQQEFGHIDFLVNNAGVLFEKMVMPGDAIADLDVEKFRKTLDVNVTGTAIVLKYFIRLLYASKDACIMNITSEAGHLSPQGYNYLAYSVSKHAANMYTPEGTELSGRGADRPAYADLHDSSGPYGHHYGKRKCPDSAFRVSSRTV